MSEDLHPIVVALRQARIDARLPQALVAEESGTWQSSISEWEAGGEAPTLRSLTRWAAALGYTLTLKKVVDE